MSDHQKCLALLHSFDATNIELALQLAESQGLEAVKAHWAQINTLADSLVNASISYENKQRVFNSLGEGIITIQFGSTPANIGICKDFLKALHIDTVGNQAAELYPQLRQLRQLEELSINGLPDNRLLGVLQHLRELFWLGIDLCQSGNFIKLPKGLKNLEKLEELVLTTGPKIGNIQVLESLPRLKRLTLCGICHPAVDCKLNLKPLHTLTFQSMRLGETPRYKPRTYPPFGFLQAENLQYIVFKQCDFRVENYTEARFWEYWEALANFPALAGVHCYQNQFPYDISIKKIKDWLASNMPQLHFHGF